MYIYSAQSELPDKLIVKTSNNESNTPFFVIMLRSPKTFTHIGRGRFEEYRNNFDFYYLRYVRFKIGHSHNSLHLISRVHVFFSFLSTIL